MSQFDAALVKLVQDAGKPEDLRGAALAAAAPRLPRMDAELFAFLLKRLDEMPSLVRLEAAVSLADAKLNNAQLETLIEVVATAGPLERKRSRVDGDTCILPTLRRRRDDPDRFGAHRQQDSSG